MKLVLKHLHHTPSASLNALIEKYLEEFGRSLQIDEARIVVERRLDASPAFHVSVHFVTPGPDVFAEAMDHTLRAALQKTVEQLETLIGHRHDKRKPRTRAPLKIAPAAQITSTTARR